MKKRNLVLLVLLFLVNIGVVSAQKETKIYLDPYIGEDTNMGTKDKPLKTLAAAASLVNKNTGDESITIILSEGVYAVGKTALFQPTERSFTKTARLTIRAEVLPDDEEWITSSMPTLIHTMPLSENWMGTRDPFGGVAYGMDIETSHVTVQGLKIMGMPIVEHPEDGNIQRVYPIGRLNPELDDLEIIQCLFAGDEVTNPNHLPILANGSGIVLDHCVFYNVKQGIVFWSRNSTGHAMRNCLFYGNYGCGIWTSAIANDFVFNNNVIANGNYVWISQTTRDPGQQEVGGASDLDPILYQVKNSLFAGNKNFVGTGGGPALNFRDIEPSMLNLVDTEITDTPIELEYDQSKKNYLHPIEGSNAAKMGVGLFMK